MKSAGGETVTGVTLNGGEFVALVVEVYVPLKRLTEVQCCLQGIFASGF